MKRFLFLVATALTTLALLAIIALISLAPLDRAYALRLLQMGESDVDDYMRFPKRKIEKAAQASLLPRDLHPEWFEQIEYTVKAKTHQSSVDELMEETGTQALIVIQDDRIVYEEYFNGHQRDSMVTSFSAVKSFNSAMIGIAIDQGLIGDVNDRVIQYLPELEGRGLDEMTLRDLLMMSSGIQYREDENMFPLLGAPFSDDAKTYYYPDLRALALKEVKRSQEPVGKYMHYNNYHPILEGMILERVTGMPAATYLEQTIWQPLGMEYDASWSLDSEATAFEKMESGLNGRAIDFARFGLLFLHNGNRNGQQLISEEWVRESTMPDPDDTREWPYWPEYHQDGGYYQYHWWGNLRPDGHYDFTAVGNFGQYIYVCPQKNLVIVRFGRGQESVDSFREILFAIENLVPEIGK